MKPPPGTGWEFREQVLPPRLIHLLLEEQISRKDLLLIFVIGALVRPQADQNGIGCFASNEYLANAIKSNPIYVSSRLALLEEKGLLLIVNYDGRRYLELEWSRTGEERASMPDGYGKALRAAYDKIHQRLNKRPDSDISEGGVKKILNHGVKKILNHNTDRIRHNCKEEKNTVPPREAGAAKRVFSLFDDKVKPKSQGEILGDLLFVGLRERTKITLNKEAKITKDWGRIFARHLNALASSRGTSVADTFKHLKELISVHCEQVITNKWWPDARCARSFVEKYDRIVSARARHTEEEESTQMEEVKDILFRKAKRACVESGEYEVTANGRVKRKIPGSESFEWIAEGEEKEWCPPLEVFVYVRYVRGEYQPTEKDLK